MTRQGRAEPPLGAKGEAVSGQRRPVEDALRRLLRAKKIHVENGQWQRGPTKDAIDYRSYVQKPGSQDVAATEALARP